MALYYYTKKQYGHVRKFVEYVESLKALGVNKIFVYLTSVTKKMHQALDYYEKKNIISIIDFRIPAPYVDFDSLIW